MNPRGMRIFAPYKSKDEIIVINWDHVVLAMQRESAGREGEDADKVYTSFYLSRPFVTVILDTLLEWSSFLLMMGPDFIISLPAK